MRIACKLFSLVIVAMAVMAFGASGASALESPEDIEVIDEDSLNHCPAVTGPPTVSGGCELHLSGEWALIGHIFGIEATAGDCLIELEMVIDEDGEGYVYQAHFENHPAVQACTRTPCSLPWQTHFEENDPGGSGETVHMEWCARPNGGGADNRCLIEAPVTDSGEHDYELLFNDLAAVPHAGGPSCELTSGELHIESDPLTNHPIDPHSEIEIIH